MVIIEETVISSACSIVAIFLVVLLITGYFFLAGLVIGSVLLVDLILVALLPL